MKKGYIFRKLNKSLSLILLFSLLLMGDNINTNAVINFNGHQSSTYHLSNGETVRIEYHGGQPHYHDSQGSQNLGDNAPHHSNEGLPKKSTRDIVKKGKTKSNEDKKAYEKGKKWKKEWNKDKKNAENASKKFVKKHKKAIIDASNAGQVIIIISGVAYAIWELFQMIIHYGLLPV